MSRREGAYGVTHVPTTVTALHSDGDRMAVAEAESIAVLTYPC